MLLRRIWLIVAIHIAVGLNRVIAVLARVLLRQIPNDYSVAID